MKERTQNIVDRFYEDNKQLLILREQLDKTVQSMLISLKQGGKILICGNGGSASDSNHIVGELMKGFVLERPLSEIEKKKFIDLYGQEGKDIANKLQGAIPAISLNNHDSLTSAISNDTDPELVFAQQVIGYGREHDILLGISTSGNAANVNKAMMVANAKGLITIGLTGKSGGQFNDHTKFNIVVPFQETYRIQEQHLAIYHYWCMYLESELFES